MNHVENDIHLTTLNNNNTNSLTVMHKKIQDCANEISTLSKNCTDINTLKDCQNYVNKAKLILGVDRISLSNDDKQEPPNKKIKKQVNFFSTKEKIQ